MLRQSSRWRKGTLPVLIFLFAACIPPASADDTFLVDGWIFRLDHVIVTLDHVKLWENPDTVPADQSQHGAEVAHLDGPWAVDLHRSGAATLDATIRGDCRPANS